jgi:hypothetical protein
MGYVFQSQPLVLGKPDSVSISIDPQRAVWGQTVKLYGQTEPPSATVTLDFTRPDGSAQSVSIRSGSNGYYEYIMNPDMLGDWRVKVSLTTLGYFFERVFVVVGTSSIDISIDRSVVMQGEQVTVFGSIQLNPIFPQTEPFSSPYSKILLHLELPDGYNPSVEVGLDSRGNFKHSFAPESIGRLTGTWKARAEWGGNRFQIGTRDVYYQGSESSWVSLEVTEGVTPSTTSVTTSAPQVTSQQTGSVELGTSAIALAILFILVAVIGIAVSRRRPRSLTKTLAPSTKVTKDFCGQCGAKIGPKDRFCTECGNELVSQT